MRLVCWIVVAIVAGLPWPGGVQADDPCDRLLRQWFDAWNESLPESRLNNSFERLLQLDTAYGRQAVEAVDQLFRRVETEKTARVMEQFLELRSRDEANRIFQASASFGEDARQGLARAGGLADWDGIGAGQSAHRVLNANWLSAPGKETTFRDLKELADSGVPPGVDGLFKKAGEQAAGANLGSIYEIQASAMIRRDEARFGELQEIFVDRGGARLEFDKVDVFSSTRAFQMKSKVDPEAVLRFGDELDVEAADLDELLTQRQGRLPVLMVSNPVAPELVAACQSRGIEIVFFAAVR